MKLQRATSASGRSHQSLAQIIRQWQVVAAGMIALSLGLASPLALYPALHDLCAGQSTSPAPLRPQLICVLRGHERPSPSGAPHSARVPPAL